MKIKTILKMRSEIVNRVLSIPWLSAVPMIITIIIEMQDMATHNTYRVNQWFRQAYLSWRFKLRLGPFFDSVPDAPKKILHTSKVVKKWSKINQLTFLLTLSVNAWYTRHYCCYCYPQKLDMPRTTKIMQSLPLQHFLRPSLENRFCFSRSNSINFQL